MIHLVGQPWESQVLHPLPAPQTALGAPSEAWEWAEQQVTCAVLLEGRDWQTTEPLTCVPPRGDKAYSSSVKASEERGWGRAGPSGQCLLLVSASGLRSACDKSKLSEGDVEKGSQETWPLGILSSCFPPTLGANPVPERKVGKGWPNSGQQPGRGLVLRPKELPQLFLRLTQVL